MNADTPFVVSQFTNPSGEIVFRVSGWLDGQRVRKNFPTREGSATGPCFALCLFGREGKTPMVFSALSEYGS